jgi:hypothetical protein
VSDRIPGSVRLRYTATGALAALAAAGAIAGTVALADAPSAAKAPTQAPATGGSQPFRNAIQRLVDNGTITEAEGQAVDRQIATGCVDTQTLGGVGQSQLQAVEQALADAKRALAPRAAGATK